MSDIIQEFQKELQKRVQARNPNAIVQVLKTLITPVTGEYICLIECDGNVERYAFNPSSGEWVVVYEV